MTSSVAETEGNRVQREVTYTPRWPGTNHEAILIRKAGNVTFDARFETFDPRNNGKRVTD